jgi:hypothetical protein
MNIAHMSMVNGTKRDHLTKSRQLSLARLYLLSL